MAKRSRGNIGRPIPVSFASLRRIGRTGTYVGSSNSLSRRVDQHQRNGFSGDMYYFKTKNMMNAEDILLQHPGIYNVHVWSGAQEKPGYVYVLTGKKTTRKRKK